MNMAERIANRSEIPALNTKRMNDVHARNLLSLIVVLSKTLNIADCKVKQFRASKLGIILFWWNGGATVDASFIYNVLGQLNVPTINNNRTGSNLSGYCFYPYFVIICHDPREGIASIRSS
jgi:hypothetical protein